MDYIDSFKNLRTNNKYGRKSPHKAVMMLTVIEMYEKNILTENKICYDDTLKSMFLTMWNRVLPEEPLFHPEAYLPFWYLQNDSFWHIVPIRGKEDILSLMRDNNVKPSEKKLTESVKYAELDDDLYFLMTLSSGRSSLKRALLETYTNLKKDDIDKLSESKDNTIDYSASALSEYEKILSQGKADMTEDTLETDNELVHQFQKLNEDLQIALNLEYFSFLKKHRNEREMFKQLCPTVYALFDIIVNHPVKQGEIAPSFSFTFDNFLSDLKISLMSENGSMELIDKIGQAIDVLRGNSKIEDNIELTEESSKEPPADDEKKIETSENKQSSIIDDQEIEHVYLDSKGNVLYTMPASSIEEPEKTPETENRKGKSWTQDEEELITRYFQQGKDFATIAEMAGRSEVAIKSRLAKLGLIEYTYGQDDSSALTANDQNGKKVSEEDYIIENTFTRSYIKDKGGKIVFSTDGKLKYIDGKLYRLNLKNECFTVKRMMFNGSLWLKGEKKIVAYPRTELYSVLDSAIDYCDEVEDIADSSVFENCKLKVKSVWYKYDGTKLLSDEANNENDTVKQNSDRLYILKHPLYAVRRQAVLRAMGFFRLPAKIKDIVRTISRTAWGTAIKENEVEEIINTISEIESVDDKYILRKRIK